MIFAKRLIIYGICHKYHLFRSLTSVFMFFNIIIVYSSFNKSIFIGRKLSPTNQRLTPEPRENKNLSDEENLEDLKLQLELSEQEASVLRKKIEELEADNRRLKIKTKDLQDKLGTKGSIKKTLLGSDKGNSIDNQKVKVSFQVFDRIVSVIMFF